MLNKSDVIIDFVPDEQKLETWIDEQLQKEENVLTLTKFKFLILVYYDVPEGFFDGSIVDRDRGYTTSNSFVTKVLDKYSEQGKWKTRYECVRSENALVLVFR